MGFFASAAHTRTVSGPVIFASAQCHAPAPSRIVKPSSSLAGEERRSRRMTSLDFAFHVTVERIGPAYRGEPSLAKRMSAPSAWNAAETKSGEAHGTSARP